MSKWKFSEEEIVKLRHNIHVKGVSERSIEFTPEFQQRFYLERKKGKRTEEIFREAGIEPEILGEIRLRGFEYRILKKGERGIGFTDGRKLNRKREKKEKETEADRIDQLEHELAYTRQELEFLKKLAAANMEAQKAWESKHRRK